MNGSINSSSSSISINGTKCTVLWSPDAIFDTVCDYTVECELCTNKLYTGYGCIEDVTLFKFCSFHSFVGHVSFSPSIRVYSHSSNSYKNNNFILVDGSIVAITVDSMCTTLFVLFGDINSLGEYDDAHLLKFTIDNKFKTNYNSKLEFRFNWYRIYWRILFKDNRNRLRCHYVPRLNGKLENERNSKKQNYAKEKLSFH